MSGPVPSIGIPWGELALPVALWVATWIAVGAGFVLLVRRGRDYICGWRTTSVYFAGATLLALWLFADPLHPALEALRPFHLLWFLAGTSLQLGGHAFAHRHGRAPERRIREAPHVYWLRMDLRYTVSKTFEILFQQTMLVALVGFLAGAGLSATTIVLVAVPTFGLVHGPIARLVGRFFGAYYFVSSILAAILMPTVILWRPDGFVLSYLLHVLYYLGSQMIFWDWSRESETAPGAEESRGATSETENRQ